MNGDEEEVAVAPETPNPVLECNKEIRATLDKYNCIIAVYIETDCVFPIVQVKPRPSQRNHTHPATAPVTPDTPIKRATAHPSASSTQPVTPPNP
jgi:hypothetical protein